MAPGPLQGLKVISETGQTFDIFQGDFNLQHIDGVGLPPVERRFQRAPLGHGATDKGFRILPRNMTLTLTIRSDNLPHSDSLRDRLSYIFSPTNDFLTLEMTRDDFGVRRIDCYVVGEVDYPQSQRVGSGQTVVLNLMAADPFFYYPTQQVYPQNLINGAKNFDILCNDFSWDDWPIIYVGGPIDAGLSIYHTPGGEIISFDEAVPAGESFRIDLRPGQKTVRRVSDNANRMSYLDPNSLVAFSTMRLLCLKNALAVDNAWPNLYNRWTFTAAGTTGASYASIYYYKRYVSL